MSDSKLRKVVMKCAGYLNHAQGAIVEFPHEEAETLVGKGWARYHDEPKAKPASVQTATPAPTPSPVAEDSKPLTKTKAPEVK